MLGCFFPMVFSKNFMVSLINSELIFCQWHQVELQFHSYACEYSIFPATFISRNLLLKDQVAQLVKNPPEMQNPVQLLVGKIHWKKDRLPTPLFSAFPGDSAGEKSTYSGRPGFDPWVGKIPWRREWSPGEGNSYPLKYFTLENSMERGAWRTTVNGDIKSQT